MTGPGRATEPGGGRPAGTATPGATSAVASAPAPAPPGTGASPSVASAPVTAPPALAAPGAGASPSAASPSGAGEDLLFAALANGTRREVLRLLRERGPQPVQALADHFAMRRPSLSEHLRVLREAGLVSEERAGRQRIYRLEAAPLADVQDWLHPYERFWRDRLRGLGDLLDRMGDDAGT